MILPLALSLLLAGTLAGCLDQWMDTRCPATYTGAVWTQDGVWESLPEAGIHGAYNVSYHEPEGFPLDDPEWGSLVLTEIAWDPQWEDAPHGSVFRLGTDERVTITTSPEKADDVLEAGFMEFITQVARVDENQKQQWLQEFLENTSQSDYTAVMQSQNGDTNEVELVDHAIEIQGPYGFEALYRELLEEHGIEERPDPWADEAVELGPWSFVFEATMMRALNIEESGRQLNIASSGQTGFQWDPPRGAGPEALHAGITRTMMDLGLDGPPPLDEIDLFSRPC